MVVMLSRSLLRRSLARSFSTGKPEKIAMVGSGNFGSALTRILGQNALRHKEFDDEVRMYVYEEMVDGKKLTDIINTENENVKYLKGAKFTPNVVAVPDISEAVKGATMICFCLPHQFLKPIMPKIKVSLAFGLIIPSMCERRFHRHAQPLLYLLSGRTATGDLHFPTVLPGMPVSFSRSEGTPSFSACLRLARPVFQSISTQSDANRDVVSHERAQLHRSISCTARPERVAQCLIRNPSPRAPSASLPSRASTSMIMVRPAAANPSESAA
eukprot:6186876-Pleurochrysis_carterae.AAC.2